MITLTVPALCVALAMAFAAQGLDIYEVNAWNVGTAQAEPWRVRSCGAIARTLRSMLARVGGLWRSRAVRLTAAVALALLASHLGAAPADAHGLHLAPLMGIVAEPTLLDVKNAITESNRLFEDFKRTNDQRLKAIEEGRAVDPLITEKLEKLNKAIDDQSKLNDAFMALQAKFNKLSVAGLVVGDAAERREKELKDFNRSLKSLASAAGRAMPADLDLEGVKAYTDAFDNYLRRGERALSDVERRALSVGTDTNGGFLVTPDMSGRLVTRIFESSPMRQYASTQGISTDALEGTVDTDEASFGWVSELGTRGNSATPTVPRPWRIPVHEGFTQPPMSQKTLEDASIDVTSWLYKKIADKVSRATNATFVTGNGVGKPRGFASYGTAATSDAAGRAWGTFEHVGTGSNGSFGADPNGGDVLITLIHTIKDAYLARAAFYLNRLTLGGVRKLKDGNGHYIFIPSAVAGSPDLIHGYPARKMQDMADYTTNGALAIAFGDMEETYQIVDRLGLTILVDPYTNKPYVNFYTRVRVGGDVLNFDSLKFLKMS